MFKYVESDEPGPFVVIGEPGVGKSALLAQFATQYSQSNPSAFVLPHFISASPDSSHVRHTIFRIALELKHKFKLSEQVPEDYKALKEAFARLIESAGLAAGSTTRVVVLIDALNQLDPRDQVMCSLFITL